MPTEPDCTNLPVWLTYQIMNTFAQALQRHGIDPRSVPYGWQTLRALEERVAQHAHAITQDFEAMVPALETARQEAGLKKRCLCVDTSASSAAHPPVQ